MINNLIKGGLIFLTLLFLISCSQTTKSIAKKPYIHQSSNFSWQIYKTNTTPLNTKTQINGVIIPHHLLASSIILETLTQASESLKTQNKTISEILLLSPNHFLQGKDKIIASNCPWQTTYGIVEPGHDILKKLSAFNFISVDCRLLENEHGVFGLIPFIKYFFPSIKIVPLMVRESLTEKEAGNFSAMLDKTLSKNSLIIVSADFSHYLPKKTADFHDEHSIAVLSNMDFSSIQNMDVDTKASLLILLKYLDKIHFNNFILVKNANSVDFLPNKEVEETTSYVSGYFTEGEKNIQQKLNILFIADQILEKYRYQIRDDKQNKLSSTKTELFFRGVDFIITPSTISTNINNTRPISEKDSMTIEKNGIMLKMDSSQNSKVKTSTQNLIHESKVSNVDFSIIFISSSENLPLKIDYEKKVIYINIVRSLSSVLFEPIGLTLEKKEGGVFSEHEMLELTTIN